MDPRISIVDLSSTNIAWPGARCEFILEYVVSNLRDGAEAQIAEVVVVKQFDKDIGKYRNVAARKNGVHRITIDFTVPANVTPGDYHLTAEIRSGASQDNRQVNLKIFPSK